MVNYSLPAEAIVKKNLPDRRSGKNLYYMISGQGREVLSPLCAAKQLMGAGFPLDPPKQ